MTEQQCESVLVGDNTDGQRVFLSSDALPTPMRAYLNQKKSKNFGLTNTCHRHETHLSRRL